MPGGLREVILSFKFRQNRVNRFRAVGGRKLPFPILKASGLYNSLYYRTSRDTITSDLRLSFRHFHVLRGNIGSSCIVFHQMYTIMTHFTIIRNKFTVD